VHSIKKLLSTLAVASAPTLRALNITLSSGPHLVLHTLGSIDSNRHQAGTEATQITYISKWSS
jgi:hypothetical protein